MIAEAGTQLKGWREGFGDRLAAEDGGSGCPGRLSGCPD